MPNIPTRIAFVCFSHSLGGLELSAIRLATLLRERGVTPLIVAPPASPLAQRAQDTNLALIPLSPRWKYGDVFAALRLARFLKEHQIDIVLVMQSKDIHLAALASVSVPAAKLVYVQQMQSGHDKRDVAHTWMYSKLSHWITLTQSMKDNVVAFTRVPKEKVTVLPFGSDLSRFDPLHCEKKESREFFGLPADNPIIGVLGRLDPQKGQGVLLRATGELIKKHPNIYCVISGDETAGESGYKASLQELCKTLGIERSVKFLPFVEDVPRFMSALDIFVLPSFSETFGYVVVEAMAMEKPVIATNAGGVPEIITDDKTGLLVEPRDPITLARAISRILEDQSLAERLGRSARAEALRRYDLKKQVDELLELLGTV